MSYNPSLNSALPPITREGVIHSVQIPNTSSPKPLPISPSFPQINTSTTASNFTTKQVPLNPDPLLQELDKLLETQAAQIENQFKAIEDLKPQKDITGATGELEDWSNFIASTSNKLVGLGVKFLEQVLPPNLINKASADTTKDVTKLAGTFLTAIDNGFQGVALISRYNILKKSKELLNQLKEQYGITSPQFSQKEANMDADQQKVIKQILEWELQLQLEEKSLADKVSTWRLSSTASVLDLTGIPLNFLTKQRFEEILQYIPTDVTSHLPTGPIWDTIQLTTTALPVLSAGLETAAAGIKLRQTRKEASTLKDWKSSYKEWQQGIQQEQQANVKHLLAKRESIKNGKIKSLIPQFENVKDKVRDAIKPSFIRAMHELLEQTLPDSLCTPKEIEEQFKKWHFFDPTLVASNPQLYKAFERFKNAKVGTPPSQLAKQDLINALNQWVSNPSAMDKHFDKWFAVQPKDKLLEKYIDHQETLEITTKNALKQMVTKKHSIESKLHHFKLGRSGVKFGLAIISLTVSATLMIIGLLTAPIGGAGFILLGLAIGGTAINLGLLGASQLYYRSHKPHTFKRTTFLFQIKMAWTKLQSSLQTYSHQAKERKLLQVAQVLYQLHPLQKTTKRENIKYQKALTEYKSAQKEFEQSQAKVGQWTEKLKQYKDKLTAAGWKDFAQSASLQVADPSTQFDTLEAFKEAFQASDLNLLNPETKTLLELQLGINLEKLQAQIKKDPETVKKTLQEFFLLEDTGFINFIRAQRARIKKGFLQSQSP